MGLNYRNLDEVTRPLMLEEIELQERTEPGLYYSSYLSDRGRADWPTLLRTAAQSHTDTWFGNELQNQGRLNETAQRRRPKGDGFTTVSVPHTANETLSEGEFNRFYIRAVCRRAINEGHSYVVVYRAKEVAHPRPESEARIGTHVDPHVLLADLRANVGVETSSGFPGPNSGLSVHLP